MYNFIHQQHIPPMIPILQRQFLFLPENFITQALLCYEPLAEYLHPLLLPNIPPPPPQKQRLNQL